ncbi:MAG: serine hydroxymethyltransferase, partial [Candidatus Parcubacteria bacterium]|nr:serine hydroxymethyltransferase [Candidatus Parcubacteria bacterium]
MIDQFKFNSLKKSDLILYSLVKKEIKRQQETLSLIPSENFSTGSVLELMGSPLMNKYSEGYPHKRYYPGNIFYDEIELLAQERLLKAFKLDPKIWSVNVQSYSGSPANIAIYQALLEEGDTIMGMSLFSGGHLTHGHKVNFSGKHYKSIQYEVDNKGWLDYKKIQELALKYKPKLIISGATAYPREIDFKKIGNIAKKIGAYHLADISHIAGLISAGCH